VISILASEAELPPGRRVWGRENRVLAPGQREALSWLSLARLLGWEAEVRYAKLGECGAQTRCAVVGRDSATVGTEEVDSLHQRLEGEPLLVIAPAAPPGAPLASLAGVHASSAREVEGPLRWHGPGEESEWTAWPRVRVRNLEGSDPGLGAGPQGSRPHEGSDPWRSDPGRWASLGDAPLVVARRVGNGTVATLAAHPVELADAAPSGSGLMRRLLIWGPPGPLAWLDLEGVVVPRMDDPGSASSAHLDGWAHRSLTEDEWSALTADLTEREARITVGYVPGWVDDGEPARGELAVGGETVERVGGRVHPAPLVVYEPASGDAAQDRPAELRGIERLRAAGAGELELHGYTHVRPPLEDWARAPDRHERIDWYRELEDLEAPAAGVGDPVALGLGLFRRHLGARPVALCCPGNACSPAAAESARDAGLALISAESLAIRDGERLVWCDHVRSLYADGAAGPWLQSGGPVVASLHDRDLVLEGTRWLGERLDEWLAHGARRVRDLRELAATLDRRVRVGAREGALELDVRADVGIPLPRDLPLAARGEAGPAGAIRVLVDERESEPRLKRADDGAVRVTLGP
jgi:hypothetical protein